ncbi:3D domain-containing protein [Natronincola ferrireducens]|uniref:G5 domain-containing protein n=1 Tax=Natronincola ferrireducens TaxID=393762 RepID=A0A1G8WVF7_9FIRM|nr:3D domain-containing protein [Natronincola ferrireducens]SDJ82191.1 protein of unknown function [Natronincola ferrireducens]
METFNSSKDFLRGINKKVFIAVLSVAILMTTFSAMAIRKDVVLVCDGNEINITTFGGTVESLLNKQGIEIGEEDKVIPELHERVTDGDRIVIHRAFEIQLVDGNEETTIVTSRKTVEEALNSLYIELGQMDKVQPDLQSTLEPGDTIRITRILKETITENQEIPYQTTIKYNDDLDYGKTTRIQEGRSGVKEILLEVTYEDGLEVSREVIEEKIIQEATNEIVEKGTSRYLVTTRGDSRRYKDVIVMEASAYTAGYESTGKTPGDPYYGITRSGTKVRPGVVAVDPRVIPLGTKLYIESMDRTPSYGIASAEDTGGAIRGNKIDLFFESREDALRFGRRKVKVYILD